MKISVHVKANARQEKVEKIKEGQFKVWVRAQAKEGRANQAVFKALSSYFLLPKSRFTILKGNSSKNKIIEAVI